MSYALLDPSLLSVSEVTWNDEEKRDGYLSHFSELITAIDENDEMSIAWTNLMDELMWEHPQQLPWKLDKTWSNTLIPLIYKKIENNVHRIETTREHCIVAPSFLSCREDFYLEFKKLVSQLYLVPTIPFICLSRENIPSISRDYSVGDEVLAPPPYDIESNLCFLKFIDIENSMWPQQSQDASVFTNAVKLKIKRDFEDKEILYKFCFSKPFLKKIAKETTDRDKILTAVSRRLILNTNEASKDPCLLDESLQKDERRLRVTPRPSSKRIHYLKKGTSIEFSAFYGAGEHDDGL